MNKHYDIAGFAKASFSNGYFLTPGRKIDAETKTFEEAKKPMDYKQEEG